MAIAGRYYVVHAKFEVTKQVGLHSLLYKFTRYHYNSYLVRLKLPQKLPAIRFFMASHLSSGLLPGSSCQMLSQPRRYLIPIALACALCLGCERGFVKESATLEFVCILHKLISARSCQI